MKNLKYYNENGRDNPLEQGKYEQFMQNCIINSKRRDRLEYLGHESRVLEKTLNKAWGRTRAKFSLDPGKVDTI